MPPKTLSIDKGLLEIVSEAKRKAEKHVPVIILIAGGSASGKTTIAQKLAEKLFDSIIIPMDDYYIGRKYSEDNNLNFDDPRSIDINLLKNNLEGLKKGELVIEKPIYSFIDDGGKRIGYQTINRADFIIIEGLFSLDSRLAPLGDIRIFVKTSCHGRLIRRIMRDSKRTKWDQKDILNYFLSVVEPMHVNHVDNQEFEADAIIENPYNPIIEPKQAGCLREKQVKTSIDSLFSIDFIESLGGEFIAHTIQEDHYFVGSGQHSEEIIRIRREQDNLIFTYKAPTTKGDLRIKNKFDFPISDQELKKIKDSFKESITIIKIRDFFILNGIVFSQDRIVLEGRDLYFIEIRARGIKEARSILKKLNIINNSLTRESYYDIFSK